MTTAPATDTTAPAAAEAAAPRRWGMTLLGLVRILLGFYFLWAFLDKTFGLGFATPAEGAWIRGGSPTTGFLGGSIEGGNPLAGLWEFFLGLNPLTDILFMAGLLGIGVALLLGIGMRIAAVAGAAMYALMYLAAFPMTTNPIIDDHVIMGVLVLALAGVGAGQYLGLGKTWRRTVGAQAPWLI